ncbi:MAG: nucleoside hydrolase [Planctomycetia bacterium]|nr:nucleoside hydrolase [Planctomycetia bacterium]
MVRKIVIDVDPGIDSAVALALALFDPSLEVVAVTAVAGNVSAEQATRNVQAIIEHLDPPRRPRVGAAIEPDSAPAGNLAFLSGTDGLGNAEFPVAELHQRHPSEKVLAESIRASAEQLTILTLGPLTNLGFCLRRDPAIVGQIGQFVIAGGTYAAAGDVSPAAEFNMYFDPDAARETLRSRATKTIVPLDVLSKPVFDYGLLERMPDEESNVGRLLKKILPFYFRSHRRQLGIEGVRMQDVVALLALTHPQLFTTQRAAVDVETTGEITAGATIFDRRHEPQWSPNCDVAIDVNVAGVVDALMTGLERAASF